MSYATGWAGGYYTDGSTSTTAATALVPGTYDVAVGGHPFMVDWKYQYGQLKHTSIPVLRPIFITADTLGEKNINPESLWRASQNTWHKGAGQIHLDRTDSDPARFRSSKGVNCWTKWQLTLLNDTSTSRTSVNANLRLAPAGTRLYVTDGNGLVYTTDLTTFTAVTGTPATAATGVASDGNNIWVTYTSNGLWTTTRTTAGATQLVTGTDTLDTVGWVKGRLLVSKGRSLYNVVLTTPGALGSSTAPSVYDHPNTDFVWVGFAEGTGFIYAAGYSGDKSLIYRITIQPDGTALAVPVQAGQLPDGEIIRGIGSYLGFILLGTDKGVRLAIPASNGDLTIGALLSTGTCRCFEGQDRFVWFGWDNYDAGSTGLGRLDLTVVNDNGAPGYASDLMAAGQGNVVDVATFNSKRVFAVGGVGVFTQAASLVPSGTLDSGLITYDLPDQKIALYLDVKHVDPLVGSHAAYVSVDEGAFQIVGTHTTGSPEITFTLPEYRGETFEIREELDSNGDSPPQNLIATPSGTGGTMLHGATYLFAVTALTASGETLPCATVSAVIPGGVDTGSVALAWSPPATLTQPVTGYNIYRSVANGTVLLFVGTLAGTAAVSVGGAAGTVPPPTVNLTAVGGPTLTRHMLSSNPAVNTGYFIEVPVLLVEVDSNDNTMNIPSELAYLKALRDDNQRTIYQELGTSYTVTVEDLQWSPTHKTRDRSAANGTCLLKLKTV